MKSPKLDRKPAPTAGRAPWFRGALPALLILAAGIVLLFALSRPQAPSGPREAVFPLPERYEGSYADDWGAERVQGRHEGTDVFAPEGTPIRSITAGTVVVASGSDANGWNRLGGYTVMVESADDVGPLRAGDLLYYAHMNAATALEPGETIESGRKLGEVGDTGQGPEGTRGKFDPHLHLGWYEGGWFGPDRSGLSSGAMNPHPLLRRIERDRTSQPRGAAG